MELRSSTICHSKNKAKQTKDKIKETLSTVSKLENVMNTNPTEEIIKQYNEGKKYIEDYNNEKTNGALIRSKINWAECGEKNTKFFLNLEKRNHDIKCITKLINEKEEEINDPEKFLEYEENFYKNLYSQKQSQETIEDQEMAANMFKDEATPKISEHEKQSCEGAISLEEIGLAMKQLDNGKSPGSDGFTTDFYKKNWLTIKETVLDSLNYAYQLGKLSIDQRRGIINLIPKKNKDP